MGEEDEELQLCENGFFSKLSDDLILNIFFKLEDDPRYWPRLACVSVKFSSLARNLCCRAKCAQNIPSVVSDFLPEPPGGWPSLYKLAVCCPGLLHSGVLFENSDFGLERELGPDENYHRSHPSRSESSDPVPVAAVDGVSVESNPSSGEGTGPICCWSLFDDLLFDTMYDESESSRTVQTEPEESAVVRAGCDFSVCKRRKFNRSMRSHLAPGAWNLSREQGNKLLASRFKGDCLYICDWPGCVHVEERRNYMLFRGIFKNFRHSRVWRTINDGNRPGTDMSCAFCASRQTWDLHSAFCLRRFFGYHDDGEPVVRAYVCENGHVSGAWTDWPLYT